MRKVMEVFHIILLLYLSLEITQTLGHTAFQDNNANVIRSSGDQIMSANILGTNVLHVGGDEKGKKKASANSENKHHMQLAAKFKSRKPKPFNSHTTEPLNSYTYQPLPQKMQHDVEAFKINMTKCLKQVQKHENYQVLSPSRPSPLHANCLVACFLSKNEIIVGAKIHKDNLLKLIGKFYAKDGKLMKKLDMNIDKCIESSYRYKNDCALAAHLNECTNDILALKHPLNIDF